MQMSKTLEGYCDVFLEDFTVVIDLAHDCVDTSTATASKAVDKFIQSMNMATRHSSIWENIKETPLYHKSLAKRDTEGFCAQYNSPLSVAFSCSWQITAIRS